MKRVAIVTNQMVMGGIEKSLITLLNKLVANDCKVTLYVCKQGGELYEQIPSGVEIRDLFCGNHTGLEIFKTRIKQRKIVGSFNVFIKMIINKIDKNTFRIWKRSLEYVAMDEEKYDIAIAYGSPVSLSTTCVANMKNAEKKYVWIHNEVDKIGFNKKLLHHYYDNFDKIFCVSKKCRKIFLTVLPEYEQRTEVFYNFIDVEAILSQAEDKEAFADDFDGIRLLTVARVCNQKGQDIIPDVLKELEQYSGKIRWYCIGDGEETIQEIKQRAAEIGVAEGITFLGNKNNPYPFFKQCDIYIQPSRHEGFGITISEAKIFSKPIILTNFAGSDEQIQDKKNGLIVPFDSKAIARAVRILVENIELRQKYGIAAYKSGISCASDIRMIIGDYE
jgi:glycosyltransferase involved in cell wall biosynthesis